VTRGPAEDGVGGPARQRDTERKRRLRGARNSRKALCCLGLFYRDALGEVARLVYVAATANRNVVREQLERHHGHDWHQ
jgi:hypothetical protein